MRTIQRSIVSAVVFSKDGKLLMGKKNPRGGVYADCWHIPGGGVGERETKEQALTREVFEETGLDISDSKLALADDVGTGEAEKILQPSGEKVRCLMHFSVFRVDLSQNASELRLQPGDDLITLEWVAPAKLGSYKLTPPSQALFARLGLL